MELLITVTLLGVLASVAMPLVEATVTRTKELELRRALRQIREGIDRFKLEYDRLYIVTLTSAGASTVLIRFGARFRG